MEAFASIGHLFAGEAKAKHIISNIKDVSINDDMSSDLILEHLTRIFYSASSPSIEVSPNI